VSIKFTSIYEDKLGRFALASSSWLRRSGTYGFDHRERTQSFKLERQTELAILHALGHKTSFDSDVNRYSSARIAFKALRGRHLLLDLLL